MVIIKILEVAIFAAISSIPLIVAGLLISRFMVGPQQPADSTLFIVGAIPIILFLPGLFSHASSGVLHTPRVVYRMLDTLSRKLGHHPDPVPNELTVSLAMVMAGLMVWLIGAVI